MVQDFHFVKPLKVSFLTKEDVSRLQSSSSASAQLGGGGVTGLGTGLSWARITANS